MGRDGQGQKRAELVTSVVIKAGCALCCKSIEEENWDGRNNNCNILRNVRYLGHTFTCKDHKRVNLM